MGDDRGETAEAARIPLGRPAGDRGNDCGCRWARGRWRRYACPGIHPRRPAGAVVHKVGAAFRREPLFCGSKSDPISTHTHNVGQRRCHNTVLAATKDYQHRTPRLFRHILAGLHAPQPLGRAASVNWAVEELSAVVAAAVWVKHAKHARPRHNQFWPPRPCGRVALEPRTCAGLGAAAVGGVEAGEATAGDAESYRYRPVYACRSRSSCCCRCCSVAAGVVAYLQCKEVRGGGGERRHRL